MELILVRHTSVAVNSGICYGHTDVPLSPSFPAEAEEVRSKIRAMLAEISQDSLATTLDSKADAIFTSPLTRCRRLAVYCGFSGAKPDNRLIEMNFGEWEMKRYDEIDDPQLRNWYDDWINIIPTGGESSAMQRERLTNFLNYLKETATTSSRRGHDHTVIAFTHGGILIHALAMLRGLSYKEIFASAPSYGSVLRFHIAD